MALPGTYASASSALRVTGARRPPPSDKVTVTEEGALPLIHIITELHAALVLATCIYCKLVALVSHLAIVTDPAFNPLCHSSVTPHMLVLVKFRIPVRTARLLLLFEPYFPSKLLEHILH
jgi:hypothetical protein